MINLDDLELKNFICNETSSFALSIINIENQEVLYVNNAMEEFMIDSKAGKCWESIYGQNETCSWCAIQNIVNAESPSSFEFEYFNEKTDKWYQVQNKTTKLKNGKDILVSIAMDISVQKEVQSHFITTQVKLIQQTEKLKKAQEELKLLASIDPMTKLFNRRYFTEMSKSILDLAKRNKTDTAIIMLDIDKFKSVNDEHGHKVGDDIIIKLALKLQECSRKSDIVSRWGGEEFLILLPDTNAEGSMIIAQKIRKSIEEIVINLTNAKKIQFTVSIGVSQVNNKLNNDMEATINRADEALYMAKNNGRNMVCSQFS